MPTFYQEAEVDVDVSDFVSECSTSELKELIEILIDDGHLKKVGSEILKTGESPTGFNEQEFNDAISKIQDSYIQMDLEDIETIKRISKKY